jgi:hypothetical protein
LVKEKDGVIWGMTTNVHVSLAYEMMDVFHRSSKTSGGEGGLLFVFECDHDARFKKKVKYFRQVWIVKYDECLFIMLYTWEGSKMQLFKE